MKISDVSERTSLQQRIDEDPRDIAARQELARHYIDAGDIDRAGGEFTALAELFISDGDALHAHEFGQKALDLDPSNTDHRLLMARVYASFPVRGMFRAAQPIVELTSDNKVVELEFTDSLEMQVIKDVSLPPRADGSLPPVPTADQPAVDGGDVDDAESAAEDAESSDSTAVSEPHDGPFPVAMPAGVEDGLLAAMEEVEFADGDVVVEANASLDRLILIVEGEVADENGGETLGVGAMPGAFEFLGRIQPTSALVASGSVKTKEIKRDALDSLKESVPELGDALAELQSERIVSALLRRSSIFDALTDEVRDGLRGKFEVQELKAGETVMRTGEVCRRMMVVRTGELAVEASGDVGDEQPTLGPGAFFGFVTTILGRPAQATVAATEPTTLLVLPDNEVHRLVAARKSVSRVARKEAMARGDASLSTEWVAAIGGLTTRRD